MTVVTGWRSTAVVLLLAAGAGWWSGAAGAAAPSPAARQLDAILAAGRAQRSVHYVTSTTNAGSSWVDFTADVGRSIGVQVATVHVHGRTDRMTVIATASAAYVRGGTLSLEAMLGLAPQQAARYANRWIVVRKGAKAFAEVAEDVLLGSHIADLRPHGTPGNARSRTISGQRTVGIHSSTTGRAGEKVVTTLYARRGRPQLPVEEVLSEGRSTISVTMSRWNEPLRIAIPKHPVEITQTDTA